MHWTAHLKSGPRRVNHAAAAVGETIFTFGGYCTGEQVYGVEGPIDIHVLNIHQLCWQELPKPKPNTEQYLLTPYQRYGHTAVAHGTNIYLWGGRNEETACNRLFCFNTETLKWSCPQVSGTIPCSRDGHSACIVNGSMYIFGGYEEEFERYSQDVYALDIKTMCWTFIVTEGTPPIYRDFNSGTAVGTRMYIFGGRSDRGGISSGASLYPNEIMYLDTETNRWHQPEVKGEVPIGRRSHSTVLYDGKLYIFGGYNGVLKEHYNDFHCFCPKTNTWSPVPTSGYCPNKRRRQVCIIIEHKMYLFGGTSPSPHTAVNNPDMDIYVQLSELMDHDDLHVLDLRPSLRTLCMLHVMKNGLVTSCLPNDIIEDLNLMKTHLSNTC